MAYHNLGNSLLQEGKLEESIESLKMLYATILLIKTLNTTWRMLNA